ncbi:MAG TPA: helix-hairpin-helix domain-containing protein, partial [Micropruina sp.]|nr:helix-hairpin-helix domain-containing protein [Micropruina sp.]
CTDRHQPPVGEFDRAAPDESAAHRRDGRFAVRLGLVEVRGIGRDLAEKIVASRETDGMFASMGDLARRTELTAQQLEALAASGALECLGSTRREALWRAGTAALDQPGFLPGTLADVQPPLFAEPSAFETLADDLWATGLSTDDHPLAHLRPGLDARGVLPSSGLRTAEAGRRVEVAGVVTHRQRPSTASGITFMNLEDEHGLVNVVCSQGVWMRYRRIARDSAALIVRGMLERSPEGVTNLLADYFEPLRLRVRHSSRDFR